MNYDEMDKMVGRVSRKWARYMISGDHAHYCPRCKRVVRCPQITHCSKPAESVCADCS